MSWEGPGGRETPPFALDHRRHGGRLHPQQGGHGRTAFQRDRDRVIHAAAFRRLQGKTQVFVAGSDGDHMRTRLTHTLEVAQITRSVARRLGLDEDAAEAVALAHDLGHPPFGHAGEAVLNRLMTPFGGFDHNAQTLRVLTKLEARYLDFDGLNLTWAVLEGVVKHNGPMEAASAPLPIRDYDAVQPLDLHLWPSLEAQVASLADDIAYLAHDLDDALRAGLFTWEDVRGAPLAGALIGDLAGAGERERLSAELARRVIGYFVEDMVTNTEIAIASARPDSVDAVRAHGGPLVTFSFRAFEEARALKAFLQKRAYEHPRVIETLQPSYLMLSLIFEVYMDNPRLLPANWFARFQATDTPARAARVVCDYIAGMTDPYALKAYERLKAATGA